jgi:hypothetical protein
MEGLNNRYAFNNQDITFIILSKIENTVKLIAEKEGRLFDDVYAEFLSSQTYKALQNPESALWYENKEFIADEYDRELNGDTKYGPDFLTK